MVDHHGIFRYYRLSRAVEQGKEIVGQKAPFKAQGPLGAAREPSDGRPCARTYSLHLGIDSKLRGYDLVLLKVEGGKYVTLN